MQKYVLILIGVIIAALVAGCGGGKHSSTTINAATIVPFTSADLSGTGYIVTRSGPVSCNLSAGSLTADGALQITDSSSVSHTFKRLQSETSYWLVYDTDLTVYRLYFGANGSTDAAAYYSGNSYSLLYGAGLYRMGGAIQGGSGLSGNWDAWTSSSSTAQSFTVALYAGQPAANTAGTSTFDQPFDITTDGTSYYVVDYTNGLVRQITKAGLVSTWTLKTANAGTTITLYHPQGITTDGTYVYVADTDHHVIRKIKIEANSDSSHTTTIIAGSAGYSSGSGDSSTGTNAGFNYPKGITTDGTNLYVVDSENHTIRKIVISSGAVSTVAGKAGTSGDSDKTYRDARFYLPERITTDGSNLYVTDTRNNLIRKIVIATGTVSTIAGSRTSMGIVDGVYGTNTFYYPIGITMDGANLYVTDTRPVAANGSAIYQYFNNRIRKINLSTTDVSTIAGGETGSPSDYQDKASAGYGPYVSSRSDNAFFATPRGIVWDGSLVGLLVTNGTYVVTATSGTFHIGDSVYNCIFTIK